MAGTREGWRTGVNVKKGEGRGEELSESISYLIDRVRTQGQHKWGGGGVGVGAKTRGKKKGKVT